MLRPRGAAGPASRGAASFGAGPRALAERPPAGLMMSVSRARRPSVQMDLKWRRWGSGARHQPAGCNNVTPRAPDKLAPAAKLGAPPGSRQLIREQTAEAGRIGCAGTDCLWRNAAARLANRVGITPVRALATIAQRAAATANKWFGPAAGIFPPGSLFLVRARAPPPTSTGKPARLASKAEAPRCPGIACGGSAPVKPLPDRADLGSGGRPRAHPRARGQQAPGGSGAKAARISHAPWTLHHLGLHSFGAGRQDDGGARGRAAGAAKQIYRARYKSSVDVPLARARANLIANKIHLACVMPIC